MQDAWLKKGTLFAIRINVKNYAGVFCKYFCWVIGLLIINKCFKFNSSGKSNGFALLIEITFERI